MNWQDPHLDPLDDLLRKADWPEASADSIERMERAWNRVVRWRRMRRRLAIVSIVLIPIACAVGLLAIRLDRRPLDAQFAQHRPRPTSKLAEDTPLSPAIQLQKAVPRKIEQIVLEPNAYELALVRMQQQRASIVTGTETPEPRLSDKPQPNTVDAVAAAIDRLAVDADLDPKTAAHELLAEQTDAEARLHNWLVERRAKNPPTSTETIDGDPRQAALRLLAVVATPNSLPMLIAAQRSAACPIEVAQAIARWSSAEQLVASARAETRYDWRQVWMAELLGRGTSQAVGEFLELVNDPKTAAWALAAVDEVRQPPVAELLTAMSSPRIATRSAAARVLGAVSDPYASTRLVELARSPAHRREALVGLVTSSDPVAKQFIADAQHDVAMASAIRSLQGRYALVRALN